MTPEFRVDNVTVRFGSMSLICSAVMMAGFGVEEAIYDSAGIGSALENIDVYGSIGRASIVFTSFLLVFAAWFCSGWLIGAGYYRYGGIVGTLLLPVMLIPLSIAEYLIAIQWGWDPAGASGAIGIYMSIPGRVSGEIELPFVLGAVVVAMVIVVASRFGYQFLRTVPIK